MPRGAKYRLIAVDRPGYMGAHETYAKKEEALEHAEAFVRTHAPRAPAHFVASHDQRAYVLVEEFYRNGDHYTVAKWDDDRGVWKKTRGNPSPGERSMPQDAYHRRNLILDPELVQALFEWHGGQFTPTYSLASTGMSNYVSQSMIERAVRELSSFKSSIKGKEKKHLLKTIDELYMVLESPREYSTKEAGVGDVDDGYDRVSENPRRRAKRRK